MGTQPQIQGAPSPVGEGHQGEWGQEAWEGWPETPGMSWFK